MGKKKIKKTGNGARKTKEEERLKVKEGRRNSGIGELEQNTQCRGSVLRCQEIV